MRWCCFVNRKIDTHTKEMISSYNGKLFSYRELRSATRNFRPSNKIGKGGYGVVHRGVLRNGRQVAVKSLSADSIQGKEEFLAEANMISSIHHPNLVELIGFCVEGTNKILVYEYLEKNSLSSVLLGSRSSYINLNWEKRACICKGTASGLVFLHEEAEPPIVHGDIKATNILLDGNFHPKIGGVGLAKLFPDNGTHVFAGTLGYQDPEYAMLGNHTEKSDVYSFGLLVLEIISGRTNNNTTFGDDILHLIDWAWKLREEGRLVEIIDPYLTGYPKEEVFRYIKVALFCTQKLRKQRPEMKQVVTMLTSDVILNECLLTKIGIRHTANIPLRRKNQQSAIVIKV